jgi:carboxyl-terminal processing protease
MMKKFIPGISGIIITIVLTLTANAQIFTEESMKFSEVLHRVNSYYVDTVNEKKLVEDVIVKMLKALDPHSVYVSKKDVREMNEPLQGNFEGIGIQFNILFDTIIVISPISGGPSEKVGLLPGDRIVEIEGDNVAGIGITTTKVRKRLLGKKGTKVIVGIKRRGVKEFLKFTITRDKIPINSLEAAYMIDDRIGYIKLNRFSLRTIKEFNQAVERLRDKNMKDLILDLRGNGGGYLEVATQLVDMFLPENRLIVYMEGLHTPKRPYLTKSGGKLRNERIVVLIDEGSASASEIVAGAIQDWDRGVIVGRRSFGKGLVQRPFYLRDSSMIRLTIARYYTPTGRLIQKPYNYGYDSYSKDLTNRYNNGEFFTADSINFPDSLKYKTLVNNRVVFGGGGIMPDLFVPLDTSSYSDYYRNLIGSNIMTSFALEYIDQNRSELKANFQTFDKFKETFLVSNDMLESLKDLAQNKGIKRIDDEFEKSADEIRLVIKALIARDIWDMNEYYQIRNINNAGFCKAVYVLQNETLFYKLLAER